MGFVGYYEASALENINVDKPIIDLIQACYFKNPTGVGSSVNSMEFIQKDTIIGLQGT